MNNFTGTIPKSRHFNAFEGGIPREFGKLINLVCLDLSSCGLDGEIPAELGNLKELDTMILFGNVLSGRIPKRLGNLTNLVSLDLWNNALTGEIPLEFVNLDKLKLFNLFMNRLHRSIPDFVAGLPSLHTLQLLMNTGIIPKNFGWNKNLQFLDLSSNKLTGTIPPELGQVVKLDLSQNSLDGVIPREIGRCDHLLPGLTTADFSFNDFFLGDTSLFGTTSYAFKGLDVASFC